MKVELSPRAAADLEAIRDYLLPLSPQGAERVRQGVAATVDLLTAFPRAGRETDVPGIRMLPVLHYPFLVYHTITEDLLVVVHIRHAARAAPTCDEF